LLKKSKILHGLRNTNKELEEQLAEQKKRYNEDTSQKQREVEDLQKKLNVLQKEKKK